MFYQPKLLFRDLLLSPSCQTPLAARQYEAFEKCPGPPWVKRPRHGGPQCLLVFTYCAHPPRWTTYQERSSGVTQREAGTSPLVYLQGVVFVLRLDRILPNRPVRPGGRRLPAIQKHRRVERDRAGELGAERTHSVTTLHHIAPH